VSDIFISYKREEQAVARQLASALETEGWTVWWDPQLRAGEHFDDEIEKALNEARCVIVMWSERSVRSRYVKDEATYALNRRKLVPVMIEEVQLPFRFEGLHTTSLISWDGTKNFSEFRKLVQDIAGKMGRPAKRGAGEENRRKNIESRLVDYVADQFKEQQGFDLRNDAETLQRLKKAAEKTTIELYSLQKTEADFLFTTFDLKGAPLILKLPKLTRSDLESLVNQRR
jgi:hypothetical protein